MTDYPIPEGIANTARYALKNIGNHTIDHESLTVANILANDGMIDEREVDRQIECFKVDEAFNRLHEEAPKWTSAHIVWLLHGGYKAKRWLKSIKKELA